MLRLPLPVQLWFSIRITKTVLMWWRVVAFAVAAGLLLLGVAGRGSIAGNMHANPSRTGTSLLKRRNMVAPLHAHRGEARSNAACLYKADRRRRTVPA